MCKNSFRAQIPPPIAFELSLLFPAFFDRQHDKTNGLADGFEKVNHGHSFLQAGPPSTLQHTPPTLPSKSVSSSQYCSGYQLRDGKHSSTRFSSHLSASTLKHGSRSGVHDGNIVIRMNPTSKPDAAAMMIKRVSLDISIFALFKNYLPGRVAIATPPRSGKGYKCEQFRELALFSCALLRNGPKRRISKTRHVVKILHTFCFSNSA